MKKRTVSIILAVLLLLALCGCTGTPSDTTAAGSTEIPAMSSANTDPVQTVPVETTLPTTAAPEEPFPVLSGEEALAVAPKPKGREPDLQKDAGDGATQLLYTKAKADELASYVEDLRNAGFRCRSDRTVGDNRFVSFTGKGVSVTAYFAARYQTLRVIAEPQANYCVAPALAVAPVTTPLLTMIGRRYSNSSTYLGEDSGAGGMCFLLRLSDGRFIVIDGGVSDTGLGSFSTALYAKMTEQAPDKNNIEIAAWFFTHTHGDHVGGFKSFVAAYSKRVKIQSLLYNFPCDADYDIACDEPVSARDSFRAALANHCKDVPIYKIHTGQQLWFADALVEIYYTQEDFLTKSRDITQLSTKNWNNTSAIFSVDIAGQRIMFLGDCQTEGNNQTSVIFGSYLRSDFVQIAHHGGVGGTNDIYRAVDAKVGLFTTTDALLPVYINKWSYNAYAVNKLHMQEYFNSADRITTFALPYTPKGSGFNKSVKN